MVIAEDGITSQRYYLVVTRDLPPSTAPAPGPSAPYSSASGPDGSPLGAPEVAVAVDSYSSLGTGAALVGAAAELAASPAAEISGVSTALLAEPTEPQYSTGPSDLSDLEPGTKISQVENRLSHVFKFTCKAQITIVIDSILGIDTPITRSTPPPCLILTHGDPLRVSKELPWELGMHSIHACEDVTMEC